MPRPQFSLKTMLWLMALLGAFLAGIRWEEWQSRRRGGVTYPRDGTGGRRAALPAFQAPEKT